MIMHGLSRLYSVAGFFRIFRCGRSGCFVFRRQVLDEVVRIVGSDCVVQCLVVDMEFVLFEPVGRGIVLDGRHVLQHRYGFVLETVRIVVVDAHDDEGGAVCFRNDEPAVIRFGTVQHGSDRGIQVGGFDRVDRGSSLGCGIVIVGGCGSVLGSVLQLAEGGIGVVLAAEFQQGGFDRRVVGGDGVKVFRDVFRCQLFRLQGRNQIVLQIFFLIKSLPLKLLQ